MICSFVLPCFVLLYNKESINLNTITAGSVSALKLKGDEVGISL